MYTALNLHLEKKPRGFGYGDLARIQAVCISQKCQFLRECRAVSYGNSPASHHCVNHTYKMSHLEYWHKKGSE